MSLTSRSFDFIQNKIKSSSQSIANSLSAVRDHLPSISSLSPPRLNAAAFLKMAPFIGLALLEKVSATAQSLYLHENLYDTDYEITYDDCDFTVSNLVYELQQHYKVGVLTVDNYPDTSFYHLEYVDCSSTSASIDVDVQMGKAISGYFQSALTQAMQDLCTDVNPSTCASSSTLSPAAIIAIACIAGAIGVGACCYFTCRSMCRRRENYPALLSEQPCVNVGSGCPSPIFTPPPVVIVESVNDHHHSSGHWGGGSEHHGYHSAEPVTIHR